MGVFGNSSRVPCEFAHEQIPCTVHSNSPRGIQAAEANVGISADIRNFDVERTRIGSIIYASYPEAFLASGHAHVVPGPDAGLSGRNDQMNIATFGKMAGRRFCNNIFNPTQVLLLTFSCFLLASAADTSVGIAQSPQDSMQRTSAPAASAPVPQDLKPVSPPPAPLAAKAFIYVYRQGSMLGAATHPLVFVNDVFLTVLKNSNYGEREVPPGTSIVAATGALEHTEHNSVYIALSQYLPPALRWPKCEGDPRKPSCTWDATVQPSGKEGHGCAQVNWRQADTARSEDLELCRKELSSISAALDNWLDPNRKSREFLLGMLLPPTIGSGLIVDSMTGPKGDLSTWLQACGVGPFPQRSPQAVDKIRTDLKLGDNSDDWSRCKNEVAAAYWILQLHESVRIEAEAGKTYYVRWSVSSSGGNLKLEDEATGAKQLKGLHLAKD